MLFDAILKEIGEFGWYQRRVYILATIPALLTSFETLSVIFIFFIPDHRCAIPGFASDTYEVQGVNHSWLLNRTIPRNGGQFDQCHVYNNNISSPGEVSVDVWEGSSSDHNESSYDHNDNVTTAAMSKCKHWVYDVSTFDSTIATDLDIVCDRTLYRASSNLVSEIGTLSGVFFIGFVSDRFGRKLPFYFGGLALVGGGFGIAFTRGLVPLNICRFILGIARISVYINGIVIGMEIVGPSKRTWAGIGINFFWCAGEFLLVLMAYFIRNWRYLEIALSVPSVGLLFYWWVIPESPRWLLSQGRQEESLQIMDRIARSNGTKMPPMDDVTQLTEEKEKQISLRQALRCKELLLRIFIFVCNMFVIVVVYYGLTLNITNLSGDIFVNFTINAVLELVAYILSLVLLDRLGRKPVYVGSMLLAGVACTVSFLPVILKWPSWTIVVLSIVGRFAVCAAFAIIYCYGAEIFPTVVRSSAMSVGVTFSRFGAILSPFIADVGFLVTEKYRDALPLILMGSPALLVGLMALWLPETLHAPLPETLDDLERSNIQRGCLCCRYSRSEEKEVSVTKENDNITTQC